MSVKLDHGSDELAENHEINVTPFIDVMLVLLIIFMVRHRWPPSTCRSTCRSRPRNARASRTSRSISR